MKGLIDTFGDSDGNINVPQDELTKAFQSMKLTGRKSAKAPRHPDAPKRPTSSYLLWLNDNRKTIAEEHFPVNESGEHCYPDDHENASEPLKGRLKVSEITKKAGALWKELTDEDKQPYVDSFAEARVVYYKAKGEYTPVVQKVSFDLDERPEASDGWSGPFEANYIGTVAKDPETGKNIKSFKSFDEAVSKANDLGEGCAGITKTKTGYSLRVGPELHSNPAGTSSGLASWAKGEAFLASPSPEPVPATKKVTLKVKVVEPKKVEPKKVDLKKVELKKVDPKKVELKKVEPKKVVALKVEPKKAESKKSVMKIKVVEPVPEPVAESDVDDDDDDDDDEMEVEQIEIDGNDYFLNEKTGEIYDPETQEIVGESKKGQHTIF